MRWNRQSGRSKNLEDRRGGGGGGRSVPGGPLGAAAGVGGIGAIIAVILGMLMGGGGGIGLNDLDAGATSSGEAVAIPEESDPEADEVVFMSVVLDNTQAFWDAAFATGGGDYNEATLVLFRGSTDTGCGTGSAATGPFYCSADENVYIDLGFFEELRDRFGATGDFAEAYVLAHEVAHHVQNEIGVTSQVISESQRNPSRRNELSIRQELQADCFAGVWANSVWTAGDAGAEDGIEIDRSDISEALNAASAVGDDRIQQSTTGRINPESWTHGSAEQRVHWFEVGFDTGDPQACDTFGVSFSSL